MKEKHYVAALGLASLGLALMFTLVHEAREITGVRFVRRLDKSDAHTRDAKSYPQARVPLLQHLNAGQILEHFQNQPLKEEHIQDLFPQPALDDYEMTAIYSRSAWHKLRHILSTRHVTMLVSGGSSMAGAGEVEDKDRCYQMFAKTFHDVTIVNHAHGCRNSFHSAQLMHSYLPMNTDVILWEFAINDAIYLHGPEKADWEHRNQLILFLDQVARVSKERQQAPPLVIILSLWTMPFTVYSGKVKRPVFDSHNYLAENYDFVVGHVNAAKYFETWQLASEPEVRAVAIADAHHPNARGHMILAYLLHDFVMNGQRPEKPKEINQKKPQYNWACGDETPQKRMLRDLLQNRRPVASFTEELPKNENLLPGMLNPISSAPLMVENRGHINVIRQDRQNVIVLPCCSTANITFDVSRYSPIQGIQLFVSPDFPGTRVLFGNVDVTSKFISAEKWDCLFSYTCGNGYFMQDWVVLEQEHHVHQISFCNSLPSCGTPSEPKPSVGLMSLTVYGGSRDMDTMTSAQ